MDHVAGYCIVNDVSERDYQRHGGGGQWIKGKSPETFAPIGPWLVTKDEIPDPQNLSLWCEVDGRRFQDGSTRTMIFGVAHLVSHLSRYMTLLPGDVISTGTPPGVGMGVKPDAGVSQARQRHAPGHRRAGRAAAGGRGRIRRAGQLEAGCGAPRAAYRLSRPRDHRAERRSAPAALRARVDRARGHVRRRGRRTARGRDHRDHQQGADPGGGARRAAGSEDDRGGRDRLRRGRRRGLPAARHRGRQRARLRRQQRARAHFRADPGAAPFTDRLSPGRHGGRVAEGRPVLLLQSPDPGPSRRHARHRRRRHDRAGGGASRPGVRDAHLVRGAQGRRGPGAAVHAIRRGPRDQRRHHAACTADAEHPECPRACPSSAR